MFPANLAVAGGSARSANESDGLTVKPVRASTLPAGFHLPFRRAVGQRGMSARLSRLARLFMLGLALFFATAPPRDGAIDPAR